MSKINWGAKKQDTVIITKIAQRAVALGKEISHEVSFADTHMNITACHLNGCGLKLQELLDTDDMNFTHDVCGIRDNINRITGKLENCFLPRFSK